jgi:hypothetical protein
MRTCSCDFRFSIKAHLGKRLGPCHAIRKIQVYFSFRLGNIKLGEYNIKN